VSEPLTAEELDRVRQIAGTAPDTEIGRLFVRLAARATPTPDTRLREALLSIIREAEEVTEAQHGTPIDALYAIIRRAREALTDD